MGLLHVFLACFEKFIMALDLFRKGIKLFTLVYANLVSVKRSIALKCKLRFVQKLETSLHL